MTSAPPPSDPPAKPVANITQLPGTRRAKRGKSSAADANAADTPPGNAGIDWRAIRQAFEGSTKTERQLSIEFGVKRSTLNYRAKSEGWERDADLLVARRTADKLRQRYHKEAISHGTATARDTLIDVAADVMADVIVKHQGGASLGFDAAHRLLEKLHAHLDAAPALAEHLAMAKTLVDELAKAFDGDELMKTIREHSEQLRLVRDALEALPQHARSLKAIAESQVRWIGLERQAHGMVDPKEPPKPAPPRPDPNVDPDAAYRWMLEQGRMRPAAAADDSQTGAQPAQAID